MKEFKKYDNETAVVIYSTSSHPGDREITMGLGAIDYITKMSDADKLKLKLKEVIDSNY